MDDEREQTESAALCGVASSCPPFAALHQRSVERFRPFAAPDVARLGRVFGLTLHRVLGRGRTGCVYELSGARVPRSAGKVFTGREKPQCVAREHKLASWAHARGLGPAVYGLWEGEEPSIDGAPALRASVLIMEKMDGTLGDVSKASFPEAQACWGLAFRFIATADFSVGAPLEGLFCRRGWLCCDDLKPDNILVKRQEGGGGGVTLVLGDWDPVHWHPLPLSPEEGRLLNRLFLIINTLLSARQQDGSTWLLKTTGLWPDEECTLLACLATLAAERDGYLASFFMVYDWLLRRGPYHYAQLHSGAKRERADSFMHALHASFATSLPHAPAPSSEDLRLCRRRLRKVAVAYQRASLFERGTSSRCSASSRVEATSKGAAALHGGKTSLGVAATAVVGECQAVDCEKASREGWCDRDGGHFPGAERRSLPVGAAVEIIREAEGA